MTLHDINQAIVNMSARPEVLRFYALGPLPASSTATEEGLAQRTDLLAAIGPPLHRDEASLLLQCFGPDDCFGVAWTLLHLIETTPGGAVGMAPEGHANEWLRRLWKRAQR